MTAPTLAANEEVEGIVLVSPIYSGPWSKVWLAKLDDRDVVVKVPNWTDDGQMQNSCAAILNEAAVLSTLRNPHVTRVIGTATVDGVPSLVEEHVNARPFHEALKDQGRLEWHRAAAIIGQAAEVLADAHSHGVVHCDTKPSNMLVSDDDQVTIIDWGLAQPTDDADPAIYGTLPYIAPEVIRGNGTSPARDVYALCAVAYEAVTGHPTFVGDQEGPVQFKIARQDPPPLNVPGLPAEFEEIVLHGLSRNPSDRPTASEIAAMLHQLLLDGI